MHPLNCHPDAERSEAEGSMHLFQKEYIDSSPPLLLRLRMTFLGLSCFTNDAKYLPG